MADVDLQELRRACAREPRNASARLALGLALSRTGAVLEAADALYRAQVLRADPATVRDALGAIGAPPSPWTHREADAGRTRCALVTGPRRGTVATRASGETPRHLAIDEDGTLLAATPARLFRRDSRHLDEIGRWGFPDEAGVVTPVVAPRGRRFAVGQGPPEGGPVYRLTSDRKRFDPSLLPESQRADSLRADPSGIVVQFRESFATFGPDLVPRARIAGGPRRFALRNGRLALSGQPSSGFPQQTAGALRKHQLVVADLDGNVLASDEFETVASDPLMTWRDEIVVVVPESSNLHGPARVRTYDRAGKLLSTSEVLAHTTLWHDLAAAPDGAVYALGRGLARVEPSGKLAWHVPLAFGEFSSDMGTTRGGLALDREGWAYTIGEHRGEWGLLAFSPDGAVAFHVPEVNRVLALDGWGRLLAMRTRELVAIE